MKVIYDREPRDWQELQVLVADIFDTIGYQTEIGKVIATVRGAKEIDVYALDERKNPKLVLLCECKYWKNPVKQEIVHAFRTIIQDFGANLGFIIARNGFQSGAYHHIFVRIEAVSILCSHWAKNFPLIEAVSIYQRADFGIVGDKSAGPERKDGHASIRFV